MDILVSELAYERIVSSLAPNDRAYCIARDGEIRCPAAAQSEPRPEIAWMTPDVLMDESYRERFLDFVTTAESIKWLQSAAAATDFAAFRTLLDRGVRVTNSHSNAISVAEFVLASVLDHYQKLEVRRSLQRDHEWRKDEFREIHGTRWLVIGVGAIGSAVAVRAGAFGVKTIGVRRSPAGNEPVDELVPVSELQEHINRADVIVLAIPGTADTFHLVDSSFLAQLRTGSVLVNVARGSVIDESALLASLDDGHPELAVLDAVANEPLPISNPLWDHPRVRITCHSAALGTGRIARGTELFLDNLAQYREGKPLANELSIANLRV